jgi:hypothetical protein
LFLSQSKAKSLRSMCPIRRSTQPFCRERAETFCGMADAVTVPERMNVASHKYRSSEVKAAIFMITDARHKSEAEEIGHRGHLTKRKF